MAITVLAEFPAPPGNKNRVIATVGGQSTYTPIVVASPPTGGQTILATDLGLTDIESAVASLSDNGQYGAWVVFTSNPAKGVPSIKLLWYTAATGAEAGAVDLSARTIRLDVTGH